jgi:hypothetical protein
MEKIMSVIEIESELQKMTNAERLFVIEIATRLIRGEMNGKRPLPLEEKRAKLKKSAEIMLSEYKNDKDLTALTVLDGEDFLDA